MTINEILNTLKKKKLSDREKLELIKNDIDENPDIINIPSADKKFEYQSIIGLSLLYAPGVFEYIKEKNYEIDFRQTTKISESLLHVISRSNHIALYFEEILKNTKVFINSEDKNGISPLFHLFAQIQDKHEINEKDFYYVNILHDEGAKMDFPLNKKNPFSMALTSHNYHIMNYLIQNEFNINICIDNKPLMLIMNENINYRFPGHANSAKSKMKLLDFLSNNKYDFSLLNEQTLLVEFLKGISYYNNNQFEEIFEFLKQKEINFDLDYENMIDFYERLDNTGREAVEILRLFDSAGIDYTQTKNGKNVLSYFFVAPYKYKESITALNYLEGKDVQIDFNIKQFKDNMLMNSPFVSKIIENYSQSEDNFVKILNYISKNFITKDQSSIALDVYMNKINAHSEATCKALDIFMQNITVRSWEELSTEKYILSPLQQVFFKHNKHAENLFISGMLKNLYDEAYSANGFNKAYIFDKNKENAERIFIENLQNGYENSALKNYLENNVEHKEQYDFFLLLKLKNPYIERTTISDMFENFLNTSIEKYFLHKIFEEKPKISLSINRI